MGGASFEASEHQRSNAEEHEAGGAEERHPVQGSGEVVGSRGAKQGDEQRYPDCRTELADAGVEPGCDREAPAGSVRDGRVADHRKGEATPSAVSSAAGR